MERCPVCRATLADSTTCRRCGSELASAIQAQTEARRLLQKAVSALATGRPAHAARLATASSQLDYTPLAVAIKNFVEHRRDTEQENSANTFTENTEGNAV